MTRRLEHIDALRGFALLGIMFGNVTWFSGTAVMPTEKRAELDTNAVDAMTRALVHGFVDAKFYSLFALLFGVGFGLAMQRGDGGACRFRRRMAALFAVGCLHATLIWFGDIVTLYAATGLCLPWFWQLSDRALLRSAFAMLLAPIATSLIALCLHDGVERADPGHGPAALLPAFATGSYLELLDANRAFLIERWVLAFQSGRFFKLAGLFLLGAWLVKRGVATNPASHRGLLLRVLTLSAIIALPTNAALAWLLPSVAVRPPSPLGFARAAVHAIAAPSLCFVYAAALTLAWTGADSRMRRVFACAGRMSFTHYLMQSLGFAAVFYGVGCGLWGRFGETVIAASLPLVFAAQTAFGALWLRRFRLGPIESIVRRLAPMSPTTNSGANRRGLTCARRP